MKTLYFLLYLPLAICVPACSGSEDADDAQNDSLAVETKLKPNEEGWYEGGDAGDYLLYGWSVIDDQGEIASVTDFSSTVANGAIFNGKLEVELAEVCQKAGCWVVFNDDKGTPVRVFFRDHFTIPIETQPGTKAILYGSTKADTMSVEMQKHLLDDARDAGEEISQAAYDSITSDKIETTFDCEAILVAKEK